MIADLPYFCDYKSKTT